MVPYRKSLIHANIQVYQMATNALKFYMKETDETKRENIFLINLNVLPACTGTRFRTYITQLA